MDPVCKNPRRDKNITQNILLEHVAPVYPGKHEQENELTPSTHVPLFWHGLLSHSLISVPQVGPVNPDAQVQENELAPSTHVPLFWHGLLSHSSVSSEEKEDEHEKSSA